MQEAIKEWENSNIWELLYADDLVLTEEAAGNTFNEWKTLLEKREMKGNLEKTKVMALGRSPSEKKGSGQYLGSICSKGLGRNSIKCRTCDLWCHKRCSGLQSLKKIEDTFKCPTCSRRLTGKQNKKSNCLRVNGGKLDVIDDFCYWGGVMRCDSGAESIVRARIAAAWKKWREIAGLLVNRSIPVKNRTRIKGMHQTSAVVWWWNMANAQKTGTPAKKLWHMAEITGNIESQMKGCWINVD